MAQIKKHNFFPFIHCPYCNVQVRQNRLEKHILKIHRRINNKRDINSHKFSPKSQSEKEIFYQQLNFYFIEISDWIDRHLMDCNSPTLVNILAIMYLIKNCRYRKSHIKFFINNWDEEDYTKNSKKLRKLFDDIESDLFKNKEEFQSGTYSKYGISWQEFNSYEARFGKKYIGYLRREYQNSRFGSYPLYDDYSEESDPEGFTNLDY